ncbi:hypothetical protein ABIB35_001516 [Arthrobacter sp. UYP6]
MSRTAAPRTCCPTHRDTCQFGREHEWSGPFLLDDGRPTEDGVWSKPDDVKCRNCGGVCTAETPDPLAAAMADPEGRALVQAIHNRKAEA